MKLLITTTAYNSESSFPSITSNQETVTINTTSCVYCDITNLAAFNQMNLDSDAYTTSDGVILPKEVVQG